MAKSTFFNILKFTAQHIIPLEKIFLKKIYGIENIPKDEGVILAINHASYLDTVLAFIMVYNYTGKKLHNLGKKEIFSSWIGNKFHRAVETIPISRDSTGEQGLKIALNYLKRAEIIAIYPEGGRSFDGNLREGKTGVARLALWSRKKVIPVGFRGTYQVWSRHMRLPRLKKIVEIRVGKPIDISSYYKKKISKSLLREMTTKIMKEIAKLAGKKYLY